MRRYGLLQLLSVLMGSRMNKKGVGRKGEAIDMLTRRAARVAGPLLTSPKRVLNFL